jgi:oligopeptide transport system ATP-binding protein
MEVSDLHVHFHRQNPSVHAVRGITFHLKTGESLGLIGESGCGKSSVAKALLQLAPKGAVQVSGEVQFEKIDLLKASDMQMQDIRGKKIGIIFQDAATSLNPTVLVKVQMIEGFLRHFPNTLVKEVEEQCLEMLHKMAFEDPQEVFVSYPFQLSVGMRQRVMIALILLLRPKLLIADEPTTALDARIQMKIVNLINELREKEGLSVLWITHDLSVAAQVCDRIMVMYGGRVVETGSLQDIFCHPEHPYTQSLLQSIPNPEKPLAPIQGSPPDLSLPLNYCSFCARCPEAMQICLKESPPLFTLSETHSSACFKSGRPSS